MVYYAIYEVCYRIDGGYYRYFARCTHSAAIVGRGGDGGATYSYSIDFAVTAYYCYIFIAAAPDYRCDIYSLGNYCSGEGD